MEKGRRPFGLHPFCCVKVRLVPVYCLPGFVALPVGILLSLDLGGFLAHLPDMPADPEDEPQYDQHHFASLEGLDRANGLEVHGPACHSIR